MFISQLTPPITQMVSAPEYSKVSQLITSREGIVTAVLSLAMGSNKGSSQPGVGSQCASKKRRTSPRASLEE